MPFMRRLLLFLSLLSLTQCSPLENSEPNNLDYSHLNNQNILILGDSITQKGTYISYLDYYLHLQKPQLNQKITSIGLSSETVANTSEAKHPFSRPCVLDRLESALTKTQPQILMACYGMNDGIYHPLNDTILNQYKSGIQQLVETARKHNIHSIILNSPPYFNKYVKPQINRPLNAKSYGFQTPYEDYNESLISFGHYLEQLAQENSDIYYIDLNSPMKKQVESNLQKNKKEFKPLFNSEGVHPSEYGHFIMANTILKNLGIDIIQHTATDSPTPSLEQLHTATQQSPLFKAVHNYRQKKSNAWLNYIGYTRGPKTIKPTSITPFIEQEPNYIKAINQLKKNATTHD